jgi:hypothetical protein
MRTNTAERLSPLRPMRDLVVTLLVALVWMAAVAAIY